MFYSDNALSTEQLQKLNTIKEISGALQVNAPALPCLSFLANLEIVHGRSLLANWAAVEITAPLLEVCLCKIEKIKNTL